MTDRNSSRYSAGWLLTTEPDEELITIADHSWSEVFMGMTTKRIFKVVKKSTVWYRFAWISTRPEAVEVGSRTNQEH